MVSSVKVLIVERDVLQALALEDEVIAAGYATIVSWFTALKDRHEYLARRRRSHSATVDWEVLMFRRLALILGVLFIAAGAAMAVGTPAHAGGPSGGVNGDRNPP